MTFRVVGDGELAARVRESVEDGAEFAPADAAAEVLDADPEAVVAVGESALLALVRAGVEIPVLPVAAGPGYGAVSEADAVAGVDSLLEGEFETEPRTTLSASVEGERVGRALADATLVTTEPARISEYAIRSHGERVARFRADGVVVATPTGSPGYARNAGGPLVEPGTGAVGVVPIAPFAVNADYWVLSAADPVALSVERDEGEVSLLLDDRTVQTISPHTTVELVGDDPIRLVRVAESRPFFER